jgi:hypothetical protein
MTAPYNIQFGAGITAGSGIFMGTPHGSVLGTIDSSTASPFGFQIKKADNPNLVAAFAQSGWTLTFTDVRFSNGVFNSFQTNLLVQAPGGFSAGNLISQNANYWNFQGWFGILQTIPQGTEITVNY